MSETTEVKNVAEVNKKRMLRIPVHSAVILTISILVIIISLSVAVLTLAMNGKSEPEEEAEPEYIEFVPVVNDRVYDFYDEDDMILLEDSYYGNIWLPALTALPRHPYDYSGLVLEDGRYTYSENGEVISRTGIDVSYHQGDIDWQRVAADGIEFAILRVGYRGYESGAINLDENFHTYIEGALDAGIEVGVYFYSQAITTDEAVEEANFVMEQIQPYKLTYPVVFDWEIVDSENARTKEIEPYAVTECAAAFCDTVADGGYTPMIYSNLKFSVFKFDMRNLSGYDFWYAEYKHGHSEPMYPYNFKIWQYASDGKVDGINGDVDLNICFDRYYGEQISLFN